MRSLLLVFFILVLLHHCVAHTGEADGKLNSANGAEIVPNEYIVVFVEPYQAGVEIYNLLDATKVDLVYTLLNAAYCVNVTDDELNVIMASEMVDYVDYNVKVSLGCDGQACERRRDCCDTTVYGCFQGACVSCFQAGEGCTNTQECCAGLRCSREEGVCEDKNEESRR